MFSKYTVLCCGPPTKEQHTPTVDYHTTEQQELRARAGSPDTEKNMSKLPLFNNYVVELMSKLILYRCKYCVPLLLTEIVRLKLSRRATIAHDEANGDTPCSSSSHAPVQSAVGFRREGFGAL